MGVRSSRGEERGTGGNERLRPPYLPPPEGLFPGCVCDSLCLHQRAKRGRAFEGGGRFPSGAPMASLRSFPRWTARPHTKDAHPGIRSPPGFD